MKHNANKRIISVKKHCFTPHYILIVAVVLSFICVKSTPAQKILRQIGFEDYHVGNKEDVFQASTDTVKVGKKALTIFSEKQNELHLASHPLETDNPIVSVEFWVYIERGKQSIAVNITAAEDAFHNNAGGPYVDWNDGDVRYHVHRGDPWREIFDYPVNEWNYVRIVANFKKNVFDFYMGKSREKALASRPKRNLSFQGPALAPRPKWFSVLAWAMTARGYIDDLLIYEGGEPINLAVEPTGKLTTRWGQLKRRQKVFWNQGARPSYAVYKL
jgi:hypothetical protein